MAALGEHLPNALYGFRPSWSSAQPVFCVRRVLKYLERSGSRGNIVFSDWTRAFESARHEVIDLCWRWHSVPPELVSAAMSMYADPEFCIELNKAPSSRLLQERGI